MRKKRFIVPLLVAVCCCLLSSCLATHNGLTHNVNSNTTNVVLEGNNYKIIEKVKGTYSGVSVLGFGGSFGPLIANARAKMLGNAGLVGSSKAVINETVETNFKSYFGIVNVNTVTVSGYVIEFTD